MADASRPPGFPDWNLTLGKRGDPTRVRAKENWQRQGRVLLVTFPYPDAPHKPRTEQTDIIVRTASGKIDRKKERQVEILMDAAHRALIAPRGGEPVEPALPLTIGDTAAKLTDADTGLYPIASAYRTEVLRHLSFAVNTWGDARPWNTIKRADWTALGRAAVNQFAERRATASRRHAKSQNNARDRGGYDTAVKCVKRVHTVARWLEDQELIDPGAAVRPKGWLDDLKSYWAQRNGAVSVPAVQTPRHTLDEWRRIFVAMRDVDPRGFLLLALGAEYRAGQVRRIMRSDVDLTATDDAPCGTATVRGAGKKKGETIHLTNGQRAALDEALTTGYLRFYEAAFVAGTVSDYALFPGGRLRYLEGRSSHTRREVPPYIPLPDAIGERSSLYPVERTRRVGFIGRRPMTEWFHEAEDKAKVPRVRGRAYYGVRRVDVDETMDRSDDPRVLKAMGGWSHINTPTQLYADRDNVKARRKAMEVRANIRGEAT